MTNRQRFGFCLTTLVFLLLLGLAVAVPRAQAHETPDPWDHSWHNPMYDPSQDVVQVDGGLVGAARNSGPNIRIFKMIPFAAPPVGALRWKAPQAPNA